MIIPHATITMNEHELWTIIRIKLDMEKLPRFQWSPEYTRLYEHAEHLCRTHCQHQLMIDDVDITPDKSIRITYCNLCLCTLGGGASEFHLPHK